MFCTVAHGWNVDYSAQRGLGLLVLLRRGRESLVLVVSGTLLGPEGTEVASRMPASLEVARVRVAEGV